MHKMQWTGVCELHESVHLSTVFGSSVSTKSETVNSSDFKNAVSTSLVRNDKNDKIVRAALTIHFCVRACFRVCECMSYCMFARLSWRENRKNNKTIL